MDPVRSPDNPATEQWSLVPAPVSVTAEVVALPAAIDAGLTDNVVRTMRSEAVPADPVVRDPAVTAPVTANAPLNPRESRFVVPP